nr:hypothetical protein [Micromonospora sp. DSM 115978]
MGTRRMVSALVLLAGPVLAGALAGATVGAAPAAAQEDTVRLKVSGTFNAGGRAGSATVSVVKRSPGCVAVRTELAVGLPGLTPEQVLIQVGGGDRVRTLAVRSGGDGLVVSERIAPERPELCQRRSVTVRYRVTFLATAPAGRAAFVAQAYAAGGATLGADTDTARVSSRNGPASPTPSATPTPTPSSTPTPAPAGSAPPTATAGAAPSVVAGAVDADSGGGGFGLTTVAMGLGVGLVGIGAALLVLLVRRGRTPGVAGPAGPDAGTTQVLPRVPR